MEHHSSYSAPRSSRAAGHTRSSASRQTSKRPGRSSSNGSFVHILLCYILPFLVVNLAIFFIVTATPRIEMNVSDTTDYKTVDVSFKIHSLLPLKKMTTTLESEPIEFKKEKGVYHAVLTSNGTLEIYALSLNGMQAQDVEHIADLDDTPPSFDEDSVVMENGKLTIILDDSVSGVNYDSIYATDDSGTKILPDSCDKETGEVTFKLEEGSLTVYAEDMAGNPNQASFSINQSGIDTQDRESKFPTDGKNGMNGTTATEEETKASEKSSGKSTETKSSGSGSSKAETKASSGAKATTAAAKSSSAAAKSTTAAQKSSSAAKSTTAAAKSTSAAAKSTTAAQKSTSGAAKSTTAAAKSSSAAAKSTTAAQKSTSGAAKSTTEAAKSTSAAAKSTTEAAKSTSAAAEPTTAAAPATIAPLN